MVRFEDQKQVNVEDDDKIQAVSFKYFVQNTNLKENKIKFKSEDNVYFNRPIYKYYSWFINPLMDF